MAFSKVTLNGTTLMDVTEDTVVANHLLDGDTATGADGIKLTGTLSVEVVVDPTLSNEGEAADAKITGDYITDIQSAISTPVFTWLIGRYISSSGIVGNDSKFAASTKIPVQPGDRIRSTINGTHYSKTIWFVWYRGDTFVSRESAGSPDEKTVPQTADTLRFSIATADTMTQAIADDFQFDFYSKDLSYQLGKEVKENLYSNNCADILVGITADINSKLSSNFGIVSNGDGSYFIWGTLSSGTTINILNETIGLPTNFTSGNTYYFENTSNNVALVVSPLLDGTVISGSVITVQNSKQYLKLPSNCNGIKIDLQLTAKTYTAETFYIHGYNGLSNQEITQRVPEPPTSNGTYSLRCVVSGGVPTYSWVSA